MGNESSAFASALDAANSGAAGDASTTEVTEIQPQETAPVITEAPAGHPAWNEYLADVPDLLKPTVSKAFAAWDQNVNEKLAQVHSQYDPYKPIIEAGKSVEELQAGVQLVNILNTDPRSLYAKLGEMIGVGGQGQTATQPQKADETYDLGDEFSEDLSKHPLIADLKSQQEKLMATLEAQQQAQQAKEAETWLSTRQSQISEQLKGKGIEPDWDYILTKAQASPAAKAGNFDKALDTATAEYVQFRQKYSATPVATTTAPPVLAPTGGTPATNFDPAKVSDADRRKLVTQLLNAQKNA